MAVHLYSHESAGPPFEELTQKERLLELYVSGEAIASGRGTSRIVTLRERKVIVKKEARGGLLAGVLPAGFFSLEPFNTEIEIQEMMAGAGLSFPILARAAFADGPLWEVYTVLPYLEDAISLRDLVASETLDAERAAMAGRTVARMHATGLCHSDLNCGNVLFSGGEALVIDFKGSYIYGAPLKRCLAARNLLRLFRSFHKEAMRAGKTPHAGHEKRFLEGYAQVRGEEWVKKLADRPAVSRLRLWSYRVRF